MAFQLVGLQLRQARERWSKWCHPDHRIVRRSMDTFKLIHFAQAHPGLTFPAFSSVSAQEAHAIREAFRLHLKSPDMNDGHDLMNKVLAVESSYKGTNAQNDGFDLRSVMRAIRIIPEDDVYINWYQFDIIDRMKLSDLSRYLDDIWYPSSDSIDIFDSTFSWLLSISYGGNVGFVIFP